MCSSDLAAQCCACGGGDTGGRDAASTSDDEPLSQEHVAYKIGRASCRERGVDLGGRRIIKKKIIFVDW